MVAGLEVAAVDLVAVPVAVLAASSHFAGHRESFDVAEHGPLLPVLAPDQAYFHAGQEISGVGRDAGRDSVADIR